jgi:hypothetical protein
VACRDTSHGDPAAKDASGQVQASDLAGKVKAIQDSGDLDDDSSAPAAVLRSLLGDLLIDYSMLSNFQPIGEGGFAVVYRAVLTHRNGMIQDVAVKKLRPERVTCDEDLKEFIAVRCPPCTAACYCARACLCSTLHGRIRVVGGVLQEGNLWRKLHSKDVVKLMGIGAEDLSSLTAIRKSFFIVCEYLHGPTLRGIVQRQSLTTKRDLYNTRDVFRCASYQHRQQHSAGAARSEMVSTMRSRDARVTQGSKGGRHGCAAGGS